ncbi:TPA: hypothetical protein OCB38_004391 [Escherichia coli]|nr:hypothetical protein [Escherichia coli]
MRDALKLADEATITARMNAIPHSNYRAVVFTKEQYARTPLRDDNGNAGDAPCSIAT